MRGLAVLTTNMTEPCEDKQIPLQFCCKFRVSLRGHDLVQIQEFAHDPEEALRTKTARSAMSAIVEEIKC